MTPAAAGDAVPVGGNAGGTVARDRIIEMKDSAGQTVVVVRDKVTHLVSAGDAHTEVHFVSGTYVRVSGAMGTIVSRLWTDA